MRLLPAIRRRPAQELVRSDPFISLEDWAGLLTQFGFQGSQYTVVGQSQEQIAPNFSGLARVAYKTNGIVFACIAVRRMLLMQARFAFRERANGRAGALFSTADLAPLETPWPGATTGDLISRMELHASLGGNWFGTNRYGGIKSLRPDWMTLIIGSNENQDAAVGDPDSEVVGYSYKPGGPGSGRDPIVFLPDEIAHYAPDPDPEAQYRGMSWLTPVLREVMGDKAATDHKLAFYENAATPNLFVKFDTPDLDAYKGYVRDFRERHEGVGNAYKTLFGASGVDVTPIGMDFKQMDFKVTQGAGETRIAAAAGTPPVVVGLSEGLQGSSLNEGNFEASMSRLRDITIRPLLQNMAGSLATLVPAPHTGSELWYDDRDIPAFQEDIRKAGERKQAEATAISTYVMAGFTADSSVAAVNSGDLARLVHTGLPSVQLQPGPAASPSPSPEPAPNGNGNGNGNGGGNGKRSDDLLGELYRLSIERDERRPIENHIHMPALEPAQVTVPVTVEAAEPSHFTVEAARAPDVNVTVEPARIDFSEGSIRVDAPITVEPSTITVEAAPVPDVNVRVEAAQVTVEPAQVTVEAPPPAEVNVRVEAAPTPDVNVTVEPADVRVETADVHVHLPEQRPRTAKAKRGEDGTLTVSYEEPEESA